MRKWFKSQTKESRRNIILMILLILMFILGIIIRRDFIGSEMQGTVDKYKKLFSRDSIR